MSPTGSKGKLLWPHFNADGRGTMRAQCLLFSMLGKKGLGALKHSSASINIAENYHQCREKRTAEDREKATTDPHFHEGKTALGSTETPALTQS